MKSNRPTSTGGRLLGGLISVLVVAAILVAINIIAANLRIRKDMTEEKLYSLTDGTKAMLKGLETDVTIKLFFNKSTPTVPVFFKEFAGRIEDLLTEYSLASGGRLTVETYDPQPDSDEEEWAERYGIAGQPMGMAGPSLYLGIVAVAGDSEGTIPLLDPRSENLAEYNITRLIYQTVHPQKPKIGLISTLPVLGGADPMQFMAPQGSIQNKPWMAFQELQQNNTLVELDPEATSIQKDISTLILVHPKDLSDETLLAIDQFVLRGGKLLAILDPFALTAIENSPAMGMGQPPQPSDLKKLLSAWNIKFNSFMVVADMAASTRVNSGGGQIQDNPMWLRFRAKSMNRDDILTAGLESIMMPFAGVFSAESSDTMTVTPLITTSADSAEVSAMAAQFGPNLLRQEYKKGGVGLHPAIRVTGTFRTAFPEGVQLPTVGMEALDRPKDAPTTRMPELTEGKSTIILIGDTDMFADRFCVEQLNFLGYQGFQPINDNIALLANAVEQLSGSEQLIGIRSRGQFERPFTRVVAMEQVARAEWQAREEELTAKLRNAQQRLEQLQSQKDPNQKLILSPAQKEAIANFQKEEADIKGKLKTVRKNLRRDIDNLGMILKALNIAAMPLLVGLAGIVYGIMRKTAR